MSITIIATVTIISCYKFSDSPPTGLPAKAFKNVHKIMAHFCLQSTQKFLNAIAINCF